ncbi:prepilin-type N-terminal cleavage/methylation domain-containing protein [Pseudomonas aeruginosa]|nr:prepilin-type N-terminal cleavage/methylation domain-containing protein [Pseudomonas aeruginosa]MBG7027775.1 prepilin-type N-terminal cleavage/methylation domain-containing protein [Pseudomonas aeruginosa]MBG7372130.1 prepilin-type N-terminal cleavage/methylation domain-containing protein [Pseudomonas aeruginosa]
MCGCAERASAARRQGGFTLIEVMVAIMLMAIVSLMAWRGLDSITRASAHLEATTEQSAALLRALNQLERDIALHAPSREDPSPIDGEEPAQPRDRLPPGLELKRLGEIPLRLDIVRASAEPGAPLQRVRWWRQGKILYRAASPSGDRLPLPALAERVAVLEDVTRFEIRAWVPGKGWTRLPARGKVRASGLEISLARVTGNGVERYRRVVALP